MINKLLLFIIAALLTRYCISFLGKKDVLITYVCALIAFALYYGIKYITKRIAKKEEESDLFPERHNRHKQ